MKLFKNIVREVFKKDIEELKERVANVEVCVSNLMSDFNVLKKINSGYSEKFVEFQEAVLDVKLFCSQNDKLTNIRIDEVERKTRNEIEDMLKSVLINVDRRLESLGEKKGIITDLLKKIAKLEGKDGS